VKKIAEEIRVARLKLSVLKIQRFKFVLAFGCLNAVISNEFAGAW
jgi:hypothetical protein